MGIVYKILCNETGECYIGSANTKKYYNDRKYCHTNTKNCSSKQIIDRGNYTFSIVEENIFINRELTIREQYWIDTSDHVINKLKANTGLTREEYMKQRNKEQYHKNKEIWNEKFNRS